MDIKYVGVTAQNRIPLLLDGTIDIECGSTANTAARQRNVAFSFTTFVEEIRFAVKSTSKANDDAIAAMMASGELARLYDKWFMSPIPPSGVALNLPASDATRAAWANPNDRAEDATPEPRAAASDPYPLEPQSQGFAPERLERITATMQREIERGAIPGAVTLVARNGHIVHFGAQGFIDDAKTRPMSKDALFRILSMTKPFVSVAAMMLVEQGRLNLADPVTNWLPELKSMTVLVQNRDEHGAVVSGTEAAARPITVHDLLRHTSGLTYIGTSPFPEIREAYKKADIASRESDVTAEQFLQRLAVIPLAYQPGTRFEYGLSIDVLSVLLERLAGKPLHILLDDMIFKPLSMKDTRFEVLLAQRPRLTEMSATDPMKPLVEKEARVTEDPMKRYRKGGGGSVSTASDYFRFAQMILNGGELDGVRLLSDNTIDYMLEDHIAGLPGEPAPGCGFGLGFVVRRPGGLALTAGSDGTASMGGLGGTSITIDRRKNLVALYLAAAPSALGRMQATFNSVVYGSFANH